MNDAGSVFAEYVVVLALVAVGAIGLLVALGPPLAALSATQVAWLRLTIP